LLDLDNGDSAADPTFVDDEDGGSSSDEWEAEDDPNRTRDDDDVELEETADSDMSFTQSPNTSLSSSSSSPFSFSPTPITDSKDETLSAVSEKKTRKSSSRKSSSKQTDKVSFLSLLRSSSFSFPSLLISQESALKKKAVRTNYVRQDLKHKYISFF
jgi:hypothetical protein